MSLFKKSRDNSGRGGSTVQLQALAHPEEEEDRSPHGPSWSTNSYKPVNLADLDSDGAGTGDNSVSMPTIEQGLSTILGLRSMKDKTDSNLTNKTPQRRYFFDQFSHTTRAKVFTAKAQERSRHYVPEETEVLSLPHNTLAFRLDAEFEYCPRGYYDIVWKVQPTDEFRSPNGFHFTVNVLYDDEPDVSGSMEISLGQNTLQGLKKGTWHYLILEERLVIHPHAKKARAWISLSNNENELGQHYAGLQVEHIELRPAGTKVHTPGVLNVVVRDGLRTASVVETSVATDGTEHISRLAFSQDSEYLAALTLLENEARVQVWSLVELKNVRGYKADVSRMGAVAHIYHPGIQDLAIGLAISANGEQIALFQEPRIGEWQDGSEIPTATFPFTLFLNPLVQQESAIVDIDSTKPASEKKRSGSDGSLGSKPSPEKTPTSGPMDLVPFRIESTHLNNVVGFCAFLGKSKENDEQHNNGGDSGSEDSSKNKSHHTPKFIACNGYYIDVFSIKGTYWKHRQTITIADLSPTLSRRITCKMMIDSMSPTMFMWLEDGGLNCSTWNLWTGANVSHIHSLENASFKGPTFRGHNKMAISPHESIVALASVDGALTTYFVKSGMAIDDRKFPGYKIEYVGFHSQDDQLMVVLRDTGTRQLSARILDSLQLRSEVDAYPVPIPTIGSTIACFMWRRGYFGRGIVCSTVGTRLRFHWTQAPNIMKIDKRHEDVVRAEPTETEFEAVFDENISYRLNTTPIRISSPEGDGKSYWLQRVELLEISIETQVPRLVFAFAPEPWTRWATLDYTNPEGLISAYFMPCGTRFVVVGTQTVQIWNLPRQDEPRVTLQFIFSKPVEGPENIVNPKYVGGYYENIETATFYQDIRNRTALMELTTTSNYKLKKIPIPGPLGAGARLSIVHAFRSSHLLAAMYMFSTRDYQAIANQIYYPFTFEEHADSIARFVKSHINRMITLNNLYPWEFISSKEESKVDPTRKKTDITSILPLLLEQRHLRATNASFIVSLLSTSNGEWIPRDHKHLNPIARAITLRDRVLLQALLDYCVANAKKYHPSYMMPAVQCVEELAERYPDMLAELFRRSSYIPARNYSYVATHSIMANPDFRLRFWKDKSQEYTEYAKPVFHLRSQLPTRGKNSWFSIMNIESSYTDKRQHTFPASDKAVQRLREERVAAGEYNHKIYVAPFPKFSTYGPYIPWYKGEIPESPFSRIAGQNFFESPAMTAVLEFKWYKFAFKTWAVKLMYLLIYYGIFLILTGFQIKNYVTLDYNQKPEDPLNMEQIEARYMRSTEWSVLIKIDISLGCFMLFYEFTEFLVTGWQYFSSPYNYIDVISEALPLISCIKLLSQNKEIVNLSDPEYQGPDHIWWMSFSILAIYMHIMFELRVIKQLGIVVNTIIKITVKTAWFLVVMALFLVGFTHALLHLLHTRAAENDGAGNLTRADSTEFPTNPLLALSATYFFLGGRWDPLDKNFDGVSGSFHIMMFFFFFFTAIVLLNLLIALMNDAYNDAQQEGEQAWLKQWSEIIANIERVNLSPSEMHNSNLFPDYVYYGASEEEAEAYESQFLITNKSNLSIENQFVVDQIAAQQKAAQATHRSIQRDVSNLHHNFERLRRTQESVQKNMLTITALVGHCYRILDKSPQERPAEEITDSKEESEDEELEEGHEETGAADDDERNDDADEDIGLVYEDDEQNQPSDQESENKNADDDLTEPQKEQDEIDPMPLLKRRARMAEGDRKQSRTDANEDDRKQPYPSAPSAPYSYPVPSHPPMPPPSRMPVPPISSDPPPMPPMQGTSPITTSPTELEQVSSPTPTTVPTPTPAPAGRRLKASPAATMPAPGGSTSSQVPPPTSQPVRIAPTHSATGPGRVAHSPASNDTVSLPQGTSHVAIDYGQLPEPSMSTPVIAGSGGAGYPMYLPHQPQHPRAPWKQSTNPAAMQAQIESSYMRRKKRKGAAKAGAGGVMTDASSAAEDDAASMRSLPSQHPLASSSSFASGSQLTKRNRQPPMAGMSSSTPTSRSRPIDYSDLLIRTHSDTIAQGDISHTGTTFQRTGSLTLLSEDVGNEAEQHRIEYLDMGDENANI